MSMQQAASHGGDNMNELQMLQVMHDLLAATLRSDQNIRQEAEKHLDILRQKPGFLPCLLKIITTSAVSVEVRMSAAVYFKNCMKKAWSKEQAEGDSDALQYRVSDADRLIIRQHIVETVIHLESDQLKRLLADCLKFMAETESADWIPQAVGQLKKYLTLGAASIPQMCAALDVIYKVELGLPRDKISPLIYELFIPMMTVGKAAIDGPVASPHGALVLKMICKILYRANPSWDWSEEAEPNQDISIWKDQSDVVTGFLATVIQRELPPTGEDDFLIQFWLPKKWAVRFFTKATSFYKKCDTKARKAYDSFFKVLQSCIPEVMKTVVVLMEKSFNGNFIPKKVHSDCFGLLSECQKVRKCWNVLKPNLKPLFYHVVVPAMWHGAHDENLWREDPVEYIMKKYDDQEEMYNPRIAARHFLMDLIDEHSKTLSTLLSYCKMSLTAYADAEPEERNHCLKEGIFYAIGAMKVSYAREGKYYDKIISIIKKYAVKDLESDVPHLRACACWIVGEYDRWYKMSSFPSIVRKVAKCLKDSEVPVQYEAALSLKNLMESADDLEEFRPLIAEVLPNIISLMQSIQHDEVVSVAAFMVERFPEEVLPLASSICKNLCQTILDSSESAHLSKTVLLSVSISALLSLLNAMKDLPHLYGEIDNEILKVLNRMFSNQESMGQFIADGVEILNYLTYCAPSITDSVWNLFKPLCETFHRVGYSVLDNFNSVVSNYMHSTKRFVSDPMNVHMVYTAAAKYLCNIPEAETFCPRAASLLSFMFLNCKDESGGYVDGYVDDIANGLICSNYQRGSTSEGFQLSLHRLSLHMLYYNPSIALQALDSKGNLKIFFETVFSAFDRLNDKAVTPRQYDRKIFVYAMSSVLSLGFNVLPQYLRENFHVLLEKLVDVIKELLSVKQRRRNMQSQSSLSAGSDESSRDSDLYPETDFGYSDYFLSDEWDMDSSSPTFRKKELAKNDSEESRDSDEDSDDEIEVHDYYELNEAFYKRNYVEFFKNAYGQFCTTNKEILDQILNRVNPNTIDSINEVLREDTGSGQLQTVRDHDVTITD